MLVSAYVAGLIVFLPFPILVRLYVLPGLALFGLVGLAVPAAVVERLGVRAALRRGWQLGRADVVHAIGGMATLALVYGVSRGALLVLLHTQAPGAGVAVVLAELVLSPLLFVGAALLYVDQAAGGSSRFPRMAIYILLSRLSQQGVQTLKSNPDRLREVNRDVEELGAKVLHQWATLGEFDFINVVEAPDTATIARVSVALAPAARRRSRRCPR